MSAELITFPIVPRPQAIGDLDEIALPPLHIPRAAYGRLLRFAAEWDVDVATAAEMIVLAMLNEKK